MAVKTVSTFQVGDVLMCIDVVNLPPGRLTLGKTYTVIPSIDPPSGWHTYVSIRDDRNYETSFYCRRFKLIQAQDVGVDWNSFD